MNLKDCQDCGKQYSLRASTCIHCGAPNDDPQTNVTENKDDDSSIGGWLFSIIIFVVVVLAMVPDLRMKVWRMIDPDTKVVTENDMRNCGAEGTVNMMRMAFNESQYAMSLNLKVISIEAQPIQTRSGSVLSCDARMYLNNGQHESFIFNFTKQGDQYLVQGAAE